jgi:hypothetical protein
MFELAALDQAASEARRLDLRSGKTGGLDQNAGL